MELRETIESINYKLEKEFGKDLDNRPRFRVVSSEDEYELRLTEYTNEGFELAQPEVRRLPKYKQWIHQKYILEHLIPLPPGSDLTEKMSYVPIWTFQDKKGNYLPPFFDGCKFVIESMLMAMGRRDTFVRYRDKNISREEHEAHIQKVQNELFGNETDMTDDLHYGSGIVVPELPATAKVH